jgi:hypothetical protein
VGKSTISMAIFTSKLLVYQRVSHSPSTNPIAHRSKKSSRPARAKILRQFLFQLPHRIEARKIVYWSGKKTSTAMLEMRENHGKSTPKKDQQWNTSFESGYINWDIIW